MTVLVVTNDFPPRIGGIESFVAQACEFLDDDVAVLTSTAPGAAAGDADSRYLVERLPGPLLPTPAVGRAAVSLLRRSGADRVLFGAAAPLALLTPGLQMLLEKHPGYFLSIYPTHRSAAAPQRIYDATRYNASNASMISGGNGVEGTAAGIPFPFPQNGTEAIWNHIMRYRGDQIRMITNQAAVLSNGDYTG